MAFFTAVAVFATWPLARHPLGGISGFGNDNWGGIWIYDWLHKAYWGPEARGFSPDVQFPFGWDLPTQVIQPFDRLYALLFGGFGDGLGAYNLQIFLSFVLSGCTMYVLARHVTGSPLAAALAGFIYTFSPFHLAQAMQYGALASIQWIPLFLLAFLLVLREPKLRYARARRPQLRPGRRDFLLLRVVRPLVRGPGVRGVHGSPGLAPSSRAGAWLGRRPPVPGG